MKTRLKKITNVIVSVKKAARFPTSVIELPINNEWTKVGNEADVYIQDNSDCFRVIYEFNKKNINKMEK